MRLLTIIAEPKKRGILIILDLEKAYDYTDWDFLDYCYARKGLEVNGGPRFTDVYLLPTSPFLSMARLKVFSLLLVVSSRGTPYLYFFSL